MNKLLLISLAILNMISWTRVLGQNAANSNQDLPLRIEIPVKSANETYKSVPVGKTGTILYYRSVELVSADMINWYFTLYDTNLIQQWTVPVPLPVDHQVQKIKIDGDTIALLVSAIGKTRSTDSRIEIVTILLPDEKIGVTRNEVLKGATINGFELKNGTVFLSADYPSSPGRIYKLSLADNKISDFAVGTVGDLSIICMYHDKNTEKYYALINKAISRKLSQYFLMVYNAAGTPLMESVLTIPDNQDITEATIIPTGGDQLLLLGTYGKQGQGKSPGSGKESLTTGFISTVIKQDKPQEIKLFNLLELKNATDFLAEKDLMNLKKKALKKNRSLNEYSLDFQLIMQDVMVLNNQYVIVLEVFNPQFHSETFTDFDFYGRPYTNSYSVFDGYRFTNAIVCGFNSTGEIQWDNSISFRNLLSMELVPKLAVHPSGTNDLVLFYLSDGSIGSKIISGNNTTEKTSHTVIELMYQDDKLVSETKSRVQRWYGDYFLTSGYQEIKNISGEAGSKRMVYFFTKLKYTP
jgi:hypothetical protein